MNELSESDKNLLEKLKAIAEQLEIETKPLARLRARLSAIKQYLATFEEE